MGQKTNRWQCFICAFLKHKRFVLQKDDGAVTRIERSSCFHYALLARRTRLWACMLLRNPLQPSPILVQI